MPDELDFVYKLDDDEERKDEAPCAKIMSARPGIGPGAA